MKKKTFLMPNKTLFCEIHSKVFLNQIAFTELQIEIKYNFNEFL